MGSFSSNNFRTAESCRANGVGGGYTRTTEAFCDPDSSHCALIRALYVSSVAFIQMT